MTAGDLWSQHRPLMEVGETYVNEEKRVIIYLTVDTLAPNEVIKSSCFMLRHGTNHVISDTVEIFKNRRKLAIHFLCTPASFEIFSEMVGSTSAIINGYSLVNRFPIVLKDTVIDVGVSEKITKNTLHSIRESAWREYILNEYASHSLFPSRFNVGTQSTQENTNGTQYFIELSQSGMWANADQNQFFWGLQGRWSTRENDKLNFVQFYPAIIQWEISSWKIASMVGIETGKEGFLTAGRGTVKGEVYTRLGGWANIIDMSFGAPRLRLNPTIFASLQGYMNWSSISISDSARFGGDVIAGIRYDIPVGSNYLLQVNAKTLYSSLTKTLQYQYDISLGYILDGTLRIAATYKQGFQEVTYQFDRQLMFGVAIDILSQYRSKE